MKRAAAMAVLLSTPLAAYYHFIRYDAASRPIQSKFDLNALPNKTLTFYVSDNGPTQLAANDSFASVLGAFRQAIQAWDGVATSDLRLAFGGLYSAGAASNTPSVQIVFSDDIPPGVVEQAGPTSRQVATNGPNGPFNAITSSVILVRRNLSQDAISSSEEFFTTAVHEVGHALGLQHSWTSGAMSTALTRATTHAKAVDADDIAGITLLYPKAGALAQFGSITGRVIINGQPVHLASVVAIRPAASAISTLTQPDGTYRIDGLPPDTYWVYTHPLPAAAQAGLGPGDIQLPLDVFGRPMTATGSTETLFYPGTRDPNSFTPIQVRAGATVNLPDLNVARKQAAISDVTVYSYFDSVPATPAFLNATAPTGTMAAAGTGLISSGNSLTPGLNVQTLGGFAPLVLQPYTPQFVSLYAYFPRFPGVGPRHLYFTVPNDAYVLPNGMNLAQKQPPSVSSINPQPDGTVVVTGASLAADSKVYFDSLPAVTRGFTGNDSVGALTVTPPPGFNGQVAAVRVFNNDGQNSGFVQPTPLTYSYAAVGGTGAAAQGIQFNASTNALPVGATTMIDITGVNMQFADGLTTIGLGTSDVSVRKIWVLSPNHLWANVVVAPNAAPGAYHATVISGFQISDQTFGFQVVPAAPGRPAIAQTSNLPGGLVVVSGTNLSASGGAGGVIVTLNDQPAQVVAGSPGQVTIQVPPGTPAGPAQLKLNNGGADALPIVIDVDAQ